MVAPFTGAGAIPEIDWNTITTEPADIRQVLWSPDGGIPYYDVTSSGVMSLMAQRVDHAGHPAAPPFRVYEFAGRIRMGSPNGPQEMMTAIPGGFRGALQELHYNIWMMNLPK
jgi:hypothetical protein